jgi:hypothetical protein
MLAGRTPNIDIWAYGRSSTQVLISNLFNAGRRSGLQP